MSIRVSAPVRSPRPVRLSQAGRPAKQSAVFRNGSSWVVGGHRIRWNVSSDGLTIRAHSPQLVATGERVSRDNVLKVTTLNPVVDHVGILPGVLNVALKFALTSEPQRVVTLTEVAPGRYEVAMSFPGSRSVSRDTSSPVYVDGHSVQHMRAALALLQRYEQACASESREELAALFARRQPSATVRLSQ